MRDNRGSIIQDDLVDEESIREGDADRRGRGYKTDRRAMQDPKNKLIKNLIKIGLISLLVLVFYYLYSELTSSIEPLDRNGTKITKEQDINAVELKEQEDKNTNYNTEDTNKIDSTTPKRDNANVFTAKDITYGDNSDLVAPKLDNETPPAQEPKRKISIERVQSKGDIVVTRESEPARESRREPKTERKVTYGGKGSIYIQVGSFRRGPSQEFIDKIVNSGFKFRIRESESGLRKVFVGPFRDMEEAKRVLSIVRDKIQHDAFIKGRI
jgi:cell division septation protein DedD